MTISGAFRELAAVIDELEAGGLDVVDASTDGQGIIEGDTVAIDLAVSVPILSGVDLDGIEVTIEDASTDGESVRADLALAVPVPVDGGTGESEDTDDEAEVESGGTATEDGVSDGANAGGNTGTPVHRDPERLRAVYEEYDTFAEMTEALDTDVTAQTVRRQMISHGIHDPASNSNGSEGDEGADRVARDDEDADVVTSDGEERGEHADDGTGDAAGGDSTDAAEEAARTLADGIDLPAGTTIDDLTGIVRSARTIHEVQRELGTDRERTRRLLAELDLLDLVSGRLADEQEISAEEVQRRIQAAAPIDA